MSELIKIITPEDYENQVELIAGRKIIKIQITGGAKLIYVEDDEDDEVIELEDLKRSQLDKVAVLLEIDPNEHSNITKISAAIRETAEHKGTDLTALVEQALEE